MEFQQAENELDNVPVVEKVIKQPRSFEDHPEMHDKNASRSTSSRTMVDRTMQNYLEMEDCNPSLNMLDDAEERERSPSPVVSYRINVIILFCKLFIFVLVLLP